MREAFKFKHKKKLTYALSPETIDNFVNCNPEYYETYSLLGDYFNDNKNKEDAIKFYNLALTKEITTVQDKEAINKSILLLNK